MTQMYGRSPRHLIEAALPLRRWGSIVDAAHRFGLTREKPGRLARDEVLKRKRDSMRRQRLDPEKRAEINERHRARYASDEAAKARSKAGMIAYRERHFFAYRRRRLAAVSAKDLWSLWKAQRGRCALTGRRLGRDAHLDHITPRCRGGSHDLVNLQWLCPSANYAKRHLTNDEFLAVCEESLAWLLDRIRQVNTIARPAREAA